MRHQVIHDHLGQVPAGRDALVVVADAQLLHLADARTLDEKLVFPSNFFKF